MNRDPLLRWTALRFMFDRRLRSDPYPLYDRLRRAEPVHHSVTATTLVTSYEHVASVLRDPHTFASEERHIDIRYGAGRSGAGVASEAPFRFVLHRAIGNEKAAGPSPFARIAEHFLVGLDAPDHTRLRSLVSRAFTPRVVARAQPDIEKIAWELLDELEPRREADLLTDYAYQIPTRVICGLLGIPAEDYGFFRSWTVDIITRFDVANLGSSDLSRRANAAAVKMDRYIRRLATDRRREPRDDLLSALVHAADDDDQLDEAELVSVVVLLLGAGHETTANLIGNAVWHLSQHPEQLERWKGDPGIRRNAIEELLRFDSPIQLAQRVTTEPTELGGVAIPAHRLVIPLIGAANRDPERFERPDELDLGRQDCHPMSFGFGVHHCIGAALARAEAEVALTALYERLPRVRPTVDQPSWRPSIVFRGLTALPVRWD